VLFRAQRYHAAELFLREAARSHTDGPLAGIVEMLQRLPQMVYGKQEADSGMSQQLPPLHAESGATIEEPAAVTGRLNRTGDTAATAQQATAAVAATTGAVKRPRIVIFVHTCKKFEQRAKVIQRTWANGRTNVVFVSDSDSSVLKNAVNFGPYKTRGSAHLSYHPETVTKMLELFQARYASTHEWFMMVDDDSYVFVERLLDYLAFFPHDDLYLIGDFLNWSLERRNKRRNYELWAAGGPGLVFSRAAVPEYLRLIKALGLPPQNHDVWLHNLFVNSNQAIKRVHGPGFHQYGYSRLVDSLPQGVGCPQDVYEGTISLSAPVVAVHFCRDVVALARFHELVMAADGSRPVA